MKKTKIFASMLACAMTIGMFSQITYAQGNEYIMKLIEMQFNFIKLKDLQKKLMMETGLLRLEIINQKMNMKYQSGLIIMVREVLMSLLIM